MAGTIKQTTLSVAINEQININGVQYGNNINKTFDGNGRVDQRVMSIYTSEEDIFTSVLDFKTLDAKGQVVLADFTYFRITNTDDANFITLQHYISAANSSYHKIESGESFLLMSPDMDIDCEGGAHVLTGVTEILALADTETVGIEYVAVTKGGAEEEE